MTSVAEPKAAVSRRGALRGLLVVAGVVTATFITLLPTSEGEKPAAHEIKGRSMGTTYSVRVAEAVDSAALSRVSEAVQREFDSVEQLMSTYDPATELSRFNRFRSTDPFSVAAPTLAVFLVARDVSETTNGAFDVTVAPLVAAWGFGATDQAPAAPEPDQLAAHLQRVDWHLIHIDSESMQLKKGNPEATCDLSGVAKGYAVDKAAEALLHLGHANFLIELGGDMRAHGHRLDGAPWRIAIERPEPGKRTVHRVVEIRSLALATSGDYRNYYESEGRRLSHLIDPRSGRPIENGIASVSVLHRSAAYADALATGLSVLGPAEGHRVAEQRGLAAYFLIRDNGRFRERMTTAFSDLLSAESTGGNG